MHTSQGTQLIYVLDDDETILVIMNKILENLGFEVKTFSTTDLFIQSLKNEIPVLCFIDLNLGTSVGAGFQLTQALRKKLKEKIKLIVLTSRESPEDIAYALEIGFDDYLVKPINNIVIESKLRQHLKSEIQDKTQVAPMPREYSECTLGLESYMYSISETELSILSPHLFLPNAMVEFNSGLLVEIIKKPITLKVHYNWQHTDSDLYGATFDFPSDDLELKNTILKWLVENNYKN
jgi:DNA-binding response OmpR family regulator